LVEAHWESRSKESFIRLSVGIEDLSDLRADLERSFAAAR
jgi:cystathionine beta-lyase/cystathionine gamma-synthase